MCVLHVQSLTCSFKPFLGQTSLPVYMAYEKGERKIKQPEKYRDCYAFSCSVSDTAWSDLDGQIEDAERFLEQHEAELTRLRETMQVDEIRFDFPYECRLGSVVVQGEYIPASFASLCGKPIGLCFAEVPDNASAGPREVPDLRLKHRRNAAPGSRIGAAGAIVWRGWPRRAVEGKSRLSGAFSGQTGHAAKSGSFAYAMTGSVS